VALGLRLRKAVIGREDDMLGYAWFTNHGSRTAHAIMYAAGVAWERARGRSSVADAELCRELMKTEAEVRTCVRVAGVMLAGLGPAHRMVTRALLENDLNAKHISKLARGERLDSE
jgi:hypothetical protein